ncbi:hypothetical protein [Micromonospora sp. NBC_01412]|uniref:hypothetical protein n=1 Tax=Micromonospora sp. NBC_01412 TaxID=2903590 RepID=UPI00325091D0
MNPESPAQRTRRSRPARRPLSAPAPSRTTYYVDGIVIEYVTSAYRGDRYRFVTQIGPNGSPATLTEPLLGSPTQHMDGPF